MPVDSSLLSAVGLGIALSACCGFRIFIPMLAASAAGYFGWYGFAPSMQWIGSLPALLCFGSAALLEIAAYYIPFVDNLLDTVATPLSVAAGTVLAASILPIDENMMRWLAAILAGGFTAGTIQAGTGLLRLFTSKATVGTGNAVVATSENLAALGGTALSFAIPVLMALLLLLLVIILIYRLFSRKWA